MPYCRPSDPVISRPLNIERASPSELDIGLCVAAHPVNRTVASSNIILNFMALE